MNIWNTHKRDKSERQDQIESYIIQQKKVFIFFRIM